MNTKIALKNVDQKDSLLSLMSLRKKLVAVTCANLQRAVRLRQRILQKAFTEGLV